MFDKDDAINPTHYTSYKGIEVIQLTEQLNFCRGNVVKYVARAGLKGLTLDGEIQDLEKAKWYLEREIERVRAIRDNCLTCNTTGHEERDGIPKHDERALEIRLRIEASDTDDAEDDQQES